MIKLLGSVVIALSLLATGCASVPMASKEDDAKAKTFTVKPDKANIYIYRNESMGSAIKMPLLLDDKTVGDTSAHSYVLREVDPGKHTIVSKTENDAKLSVDTKAGKNYFVWQEVKMGAWAAASELHLVDEAKGKAGVNECKLIQ